MYDNKTHKVKDRIVSISQPYIRPIVRGKAKAPVEFGAKLDMSIDEKGIARLEKLSFDAYNEEDVLVTAIENYRKRTGHYPERVLVDQIYRNQKNRAYCKSRKIGDLRQGFGETQKESHIGRKENCTSDNMDRIEVEREVQFGKTLLWHGTDYYKARYYDQVIHCTFHSRNESRQSGKSLFCLQLFTRYSC